MDLTNSLDPDQAGRFARPDLSGLNCFQRTILAGKELLFGLVEIR